MQHARMSWLSIAILSMLLLAPAAGLAGPNAGGTLVLHTNPGLVYCDDTQNYCGQAGLGACEQAITRHDGFDTAVFHVLAAFPTSGSPRLSGVIFGIDYDSARVILLGRGMCGDFELSTNDWPGPGSGTAITWNSAQTTHLVEIYWFAGYNYASPAPASFAIVDHPNRGGGCCFGDDAIPSNLDPIAGYGALGFDQPGTLICPGGGEIGACCFSDCSCVVLPELACTGQGGNFQGAGVSCDPNPCCPPPLGACCLGCECFVVTEADCIQQGGVYHGDNAPCSYDTCGEGPAACCFEDQCFIITSCQCENLGGEFLGDITTCDPYPCAPPVPTDRQSWGRVKARYR